MTDDLAEAGAPEVQAAELALGVLDGDERAAALRRVLADRAFAAEVEWWRFEFAALYDAVPAVDPPATLFDRIGRSLNGRPDSAAIPVGRRWLWPSLTGVSTAAAAVLLAIVALRPPPAPVVVASPPSVLLAAALAPTDDAAPLSAVYDARAGTLRLPAAAIADARHSAELWVIGADGVPYSLGLLRRGEPTAVPVTAANRSRLSANAVLAVSIEPVGGSPTGAPTGPVVVKGALLIS